MYKDSIRESLRNLLRRPVQSTLAILGITCGIAGSLLLGSIGQGVNSSVMSQIDQIGPGLMTVVPTPSTDQGQTSLTLNNEDANSLTAEDLAGGVETPVLQMNAHLTSENKDTDTVAIGVNSQFPMIRSMTIVEGHFFNQIQEQNHQYLAVIGETVAKQLFPHGSPIGKTVILNSTALQVIGVCRLDNGGQANDVNNLLFLPISTMQEDLLSTTEINALLIKVPDPSNVQKVDANIHNRLMQSHRWTIHDDSITIFKQDQILQSASSLNHLIGLFVKGSILIAFLIGGIGIMNVMLMAATERQHEIGVYLAFGAKPLYIHMQFLLEAFMISLFGVLSGVLIGTIIGLIFAANGSIPWAFSWRNYLATGCGGLFVGLISGTYPSFRAAHVRPSDVLRK